MKKGFYKYLLGVLILLIFDQSIKYYVFHNLPKMNWLHPFYPFGGIGVFKDFFGITFSINYLANTGAAWGTFSSYGKFLFFLRIVIVLFLIVYLFHFNKVKRRSFPLFLIISGAIGNILDYVLYGHVVDMFNFNFWGYSYPVFNIADSYITIGVIWLLLISLFPIDKKVV